LSDYDYCDFDFEDYDRFTANEYNELEEWMDQDGVVWEPHEMATSHLQNLVAFVGRGRKGNCSTLEVAQNYAKLCEKELESRRDTQF
jgi:hypothetical protein